MDKRIAAGGVGQVWRATDLLLERPVAVKVLRPEYADHPDTLARFRKEARHAGALSHPNVAQVYDYGAAGPDYPPFLVMEFVDGPSLADVLAVDPVEPEYALDILAQAAEGLYAAHRAGLVHRDVKPGNILIGPERLVKVTDFGIAHAAGQAPVTAPNLVMGTTQYMAPERISGGQASPASDLYALGIVLHECLTGVPPFEGSPAEVMASHLYLPLPPLPAGTPPELDDLVARLVARDPSRRLSDARDLALRAAGLREAMLAGNLVSSGAVPVSAASPAGGTAMPPGPSRYSGHSGAESATAVLAPGTASVPTAPASPGTGPGGLGFGTGQTVAPGTPAPPVAPGVTGTPGGGTGGPGLGGTGGPGSGAGPVATGTPGYSDEWRVPDRLSVPVSAPGGRTPPPRRISLRTVTVVVGAAVIAAVVMVVLLVSGGLRSAGQGSASPSPSPSATRGNPDGRTSHPAAKASSPASSPAGFTPAGGPPTGTATPGQSATATPSGGKSGRQSPSGSPATSGPATTPGGSGPPSGGGPSTQAPSSPPASAPGSTVTPSPSPSSCFLGLCL